MSMNYWILASLDPTNQFMPYILYDKKPPCDRVFCEYTK